MEKRVLLAVALSMMVLGLYPLVLQKLYPDYARKTAVSRPAAGKMAGAAVSKTSPVEGPAVSPDDNLPFRTDKLSLVFNAEGAGIREVDFPEFIDSDTKKPLQFFSLKTTDAVPGSIRFVEGPQTPLRYQAKAGAGEVVWTSQDTHEGIRVSKRYVFHSGYSADLEVTFENTASSPVDLQYEIFAGSRIPPRHSIDTQYIEANFFSRPGGKESVRHIKESGLGKEVRSQTPVEWLAIKDRHFSVILKPASGSGFSGLVRGLGHHQMSAALVSSKVTVPAGGSVRDTFLVYIGPNRLEELLPLGLDPIVNFGKLDAIGKVLVGALEILNKVLKNYGLAIIALTAIINLLLFPLTRQSYMAMKRMQLIQPHMQKLREQHKKNPEKLNKETMELYRKHKVNPFGGCLPMVVQMPVFIALYVALSKSVLLIDSKLFWIQDLSSPDRLTLPVALPFLGNEIHVLPLVMAGAMFLQQKFTQVKMEGQDPAMESQQKMMTLMMPVIFGFIFYSMPSGLVLYWLTNTLLMTSYQLRLKKVTLT